MALSDLQRRLELLAFLAIVVTGTRLDVLPP